MLQFDVTFSNDFTSICDALSSTDCTVARKGNRLIIETEHDYKDGVCTRCDHVCDNSFHNGVCPECNMGVSANLKVGSALSEGNMIIICTVAAAVVFGLGGFILGTKKKKKTALANGTDNTDEE